MTGPYGGARDARLGGLPLAERFLRHAASLERAGRSPLYATLMRAAGEDIAAGGPVAGLFADVPVTPGSVPSLRLLAALHHVVLEGLAPELAAYYPSVGGDLPAAEVSPVALEALQVHAGRISERLGRTVQTNDPGRAAVLFGALLGLVARDDQPVRLLEIGASMGLNLLPDRYAYVVDGEVLGDPASTVRLVEPWRGSPLPLGSEAARPRIVAREGCDAAPLDPRDPEDRLTALSYIWPDEPARLARVRAALEIARADPPRVVARRAEDWLPEVLADAPAGRLTVVWQSLVRQYVEPEAWDRIEHTIDAAIERAGPGGVTWLRMEPSEDHLADLRLTLRTTPGGPDRLLARCDDHGPLVVWERS